MHVSISLKPRCRNIFIFQIKDCGLKKLKSSEKNSNNSYEIKNEKIFNFLTLYFFNPACV